VYFDVRDQIKKQTPWPLVRERNWSYFLHSSDTGKKWEYNETVHQLFVDFKKACDSVRRGGLYNILIEQGVWRTTVISCFAKNSRTRNDVWAGVLSWCSIQVLFLHPADLIHLILRSASLKRFMTSKYSRPLTAWPRGTNSWWTTPFPSKNLFQLAKIAKGTEDRLTLLYVLDD
jgi:hypothetical protein